MKEAMQSLEQSPSMTKLSVIKEVTPRQMVLDMLKKHDFGIDGYEIPPSLTRSPRPTQPKSKSPGVIEMIAKHHSKVPGVGRYENRYEKTWDQQI